MKRILIPALCFISVINAADETKEIEYAINGTRATCKGYTLGEEEQAYIDFIGMQEDENKTTIIARARGTSYPLERCALYSFHGPHNSGNNHFYLEQGILINQSTHFNPSNFKDYNVTLKAFELLRLYTSTHAKRTLSIENKPVSEGEESKE